MRTSASCTYVTAAVAELSRMYSEASKAECREKESLKNQGSLQKTTKTQLM